LIVRQCALLLAVDVSPFGVLGVIQLTLWRFPSVPLLVAAATPESRFF